MSLKNKLTEKSARITGDKPYVEIGDTTGKGTSKVYVGHGTLSEDDLIRGWQLDPNEWQIIPGSLRVNKWLQNAEDEIWAYQYKAGLEKKTSAEAYQDWDDIPPLVDVKVKVSATRRSKRPITDLKCAIILPDSQISYWRDTNEIWRTTHDEAALDITRQIISDVENEHGIDKIVDLGDFLDATHFSRHRSAPSQVDRFGFRKAVARAQQELAARTALTPNAERHLIPGNHENRINHFLVDNGLGFLMGLNVDDTDPVLSLEWLLQSKKHGWVIEEAYPEGAVYLNHNTVCIHGTSAKGVPGATAVEYLKQELNTFFGHTPRAQVVHRTIARHGQTRTYVAATAGGLMKISGAVPSGFSGIRITGDPVLAKGTAWDQGFSVVFYDPEGHTTPQVENVMIVNGKAVWRGRVYEATVDADGYEL